MQSQQMNEPTRRSPRLTTPLFPLMKSRLKPIKSEATIISPNIGREHSGERGWEERMTQIVAWIAYVVGLVASVTFVVVYLADIRWRLPRPRNEPKTTKRARRVLLSLAGALAVRYVSGIIDLVVSHNAPHDTLPAVTGGVVAAALMVYLIVLWWQDRIDQRRERK